MNGAVRIRTERGEDGTTRLRELAATVPFAVKARGTTVFVVGAAATPLDGDRVHFDLDVGPGTELTVRTVAATMAWPSRSTTAPSRTCIAASVGDGAVLRWLPEPIIPVTGCHHELQTRIALASSAKLLWREELVLGRHGEPPGDLEVDTRVERDGRALLHAELRVGDPSGIHRAPSLVGAARGLGSVLAVGPGVPEHVATAQDPELLGAVLELEGGGRLAQAVASSVPAMRRWLDDRQRGLAHIGVRDAPSSTRTFVPELA